MDDKKWDGWAGLVLVLVVVAVSYVPSRLLFPIEQRLSFRFITWVALLFASAFIVPRVLIRTGYLTDLRVKKRLMFNFLDLTMYVGVLALAICAADFVQWTIGPLEKTRAIVFCLVVSIASCAVYWFAIRWLRRALDLYR